MIFLKRKFIIFLLILSIIANNFLFFDYYGRIAHGGREVALGQPFVKSSGVQPVEDSNLAKEKAESKGDKGISCSSGWRFWGIIDNVVCFIIKLIALVPHFIDKALSYVNKVIGWIVDYLSSLNPFAEGDRFKILNIPDPIAILWSILVNISSIFLVFFALAAAFQYLFGEDAIAKRNLFYILLVALLIQFSYLFVEQAFKLTFALEKGLSGGASNQIGSIIVASFWLVNPTETFEGSATAIIGDVFKTGDDRSKEVSIVKEAFMYLLQYIALAALQFIALMVLIALAILFVARYLVIIVLTGLAPIAMTSIAIPQFKEGALANLTAKFRFFSTWLSLLVSWLLIIPVIVFGVLICVIIAKGFFLGGMIAATASGSLMGDINDIAKFALGVLLTLGCDLAAFNIGLSLTGTVGEIVKIAGKAGIGLAVAGSIGAVAAGAKPIVYSEKVSQVTGNFFKRASEKIQDVGRWGMNKRMLRTPFAYLHNFGSKLYNRADVYLNRAKEYRESLTNVVTKEALIEETRRVRRNIEEPSLESRLRAQLRNIDNQINSLKEKGYTDESQEIKKFQSQKETINKKLGKLEKKEESKKKKLRDKLSKIDNKINLLKLKKERGYADESKIIKLQEKKTKIAEELENLEKKKYKEVILQRLVPIIATASADPKLLSEVYSNFNKEMADYLVMNMAKKPELLNIFSSEVAFRDSETAKAATQIFTKASKRAALDFVASANLEDLSLFSDIATKDIMERIGKESFLKLLQERARLHGSINLPQQFIDIINKEGADLYDALQAEKKDPHKIVDALVKIGGKVISDVNTLFALSQQLGLELDTIYDLILKRTAGKERRDFLGGIAISSVSEEARKSFVDFLNKNSKVIERFSTQERALIEALGVQIPSKIEKKEEQREVEDKRSKSASPAESQEDILRLAGLGIAPVNKEYLEKKENRENVVKGINEVSNININDIKIMLRGDIFSTFLEYGKYDDSNEAMVNLFEKIKDKLDKNQLEEIISNIDKASVVESMPENHWVKQWLAKAREALKAKEDSSKESSAEGESEGTDSN